MMGRIYSIDPGLSGTGWAAWSTRRRPDRCGTYTRAPGDTLTMRCDWVAKKIRAMIRQDNAMVASTHVFIEMPMQMPTSARGIAAQAGGIYKLTFLVGYIAATVFPCEVFEITPLQWKGQLPKDVVVSRVQQYLGKGVCDDLDIRSHAWDAVGLGLWATGVWRN